MLTLMASQANSTLCTAHLRSFLIQLIFDCLPVEWPTVETKTKNTTAGRVKTCSLTCPLPASQDLLIPRWASGYPDERRGQGKIVKSQDVPWFTFRAYIAVATGVVACTNAATWWCDGWWGVHVTTYMHNNTVWIPFMCHRNNFTYHVILLAGPGDTTTSHQRLGWEGYWHTSGNCDSICQDSASGF